MSLHQKCQNLEKKKKSLTWSSIHYLLIDRIGVGFYKYKYLYYIYNFLVLVFFLIYGGGHAKIPLFRLEQKSSHWSLKW